MQVIRRSQALVIPLQSRATPAAPRQPTAADRFETRAVAPVAAAPTQPLFGLPTSWQFSVDKGTGQRTDPVTFYVHGSLDDLRSALKAGGWTEADPYSMGNNLKYLGNAAKQEVYNALSYGAKAIDGIEVGLAGVFGFHPKPWLSTTPKQVPGVQEMPVSAQTLDGRPFVTAFEANNRPLGGRDHLRIFDTGTVDADGQPVWAIATTRDTGLRFDPNSPGTGFLGHQIEANVVAERDLVLSVLEKSGQVTQNQPFSMGLIRTRGLNGAYVGDNKGYELSVGPAAGAVTNWS